MTAPNPEIGLGSIVKRTLDLVAFPHSIFALPFALASMLYAAQGLPSWRIVGLILVCMVTARNAAMAFNRLVDADIDKQNPRTQDRHLPSGLLSTEWVVFFTVINALIFLGAAYQINPLSFLCAMPVLAWLLGYSYSKRFTSYSHLILGFALGLSPVGAWIAVTGDLLNPAWWLCLAVVGWVAGFDIIYACQDIEFDRRFGMVHSIPQRLGIDSALRWSQGMHMLMIVCLSVFGVVMKVGIPFWTGLLIVIAFLIYQHRLAARDIKANMNRAFFTSNGMIAILFFLFVLADIFA